MKLFKHGENLAVIIPQSLKKRHDIKDDDDFEFIEIEKHCFLLISKASLAEQAKKTVFLQLVNKAMKNGESLMDNGEKLEPKEHFEEKAISPQVSSSFSAATNYAKPNQSYSAQAPANFAGFAAKVFSNGYLVLASEEEAREASRTLEELIKQQKVFGIRGFDKKFYIVSSDYYSKFSPQVLSLLSTKKMSILELNAQLKIPEEGVVAILQILKDKGEIIESRKNLFEIIK